jgi:nucleotide-binding universal stress UspA family protein
MIVVGSTHRGALGRIATGTTADRVLDGAACPVVVAPKGLGETWGGAGQVGVAFVDTPGGWSALRAGAAIARRMDSRLVAYTVTDPQTQDRDRGRAQESVERAIAELAGDLDGEARMLEEGAPALIEASRGLDFLVRGCRSAGGLRSPLARELPGRLARDVACPLVAVSVRNEQQLVSLFAAEAVDERSAALHA